MLDVARALPAWFNDDGLEQIERDALMQAGAVAESEGQPVGFVTWVTDGEMGEIGWIGVHPDHHGDGIGRQLVSMAETAIGEAGVTELFVETLGESVEYEPCDGTRAFYRAVGFVDFEAWPTDNPGMPEVLRLRKVL